MKSHPRFLLLALAPLLASLITALLLHKDLLHQKTIEAVKSRLLQYAEETAQTQEAADFLRGFSHSGLESLVRDTLDASGTLTGMAVLDAGGIRFAYPDELDAGTIPEYPKERVVVMPDKPGTLIRAFAPIKDKDETRGAVVAETTLSLVLGKRRQMVLTIAACLLTGLAVAVAGAAIAARRLRRGLLDMEPEEIAAGYSSHVSMMEALHEGVVAIDEHGMITMSNKTAKRLLGQKGRDLNARHIRDIMQDTRLPEVAATGKAEYNREQQVHGRVLIVSRVPIVEKGQPTGAVAVFQDKSRVVQLAEELTGARQLVDTLRAASHEFRNKTHVILGLLERGHVDRAKQYILDIQRDRSDLNRKLVHSFRDPVVAGLVFAKSVSCGEQGVRLEIAPGGGLEPIGSHDLNHALVTITGNLIDNAMESARDNANGEGRVVLGVTEKPGHIEVEVRDNGPGIPPDVVENIFTRGFSTKGAGRGTGLYLVKEVTESAGGTVSVRSSPLETVFSVHLPK